MVFSLQASSKTSTLGFSSTATVLVSAGDCMPPAISLICILVDSSGTPNSLLSKTTIDENPSVDVITKVEPSGDLFLKYQTIAEINPL